MAYGDSTFTAPFTGLYVAEAWGAGFKSGNAGAHTPGVGGGGGAYSRRHNIALTMGTGYGVRVGAPGGVAAPHESGFISLAVCLAEGAPDYHGGDAATGGGDVKFSGGDGKYYTVDDIAGGGGGSSATRTADGNDGGVQNGAIPPDNTGGKGGDGSLPGNGAPPTAGDSQPGHTAIETGGGGGGPGPGINGNPGAFGDGCEGCVILWEDTGVWPPAPGTVPIASYGTLPPGALPVSNRRNQGFVL